MRVFDITKEYAPAFAEFIPAYVLAQIDVEGFHTIGEVATDGSDHYAAGLLQYYDGNFSDNDEARITYLYVPEDERGESNAWSMLHFMEDRVKSKGIKRVSVYLGGIDRKIMEGYLINRGYTALDDETHLIKTTFSEMMSEKILSMPTSKNVSSMADVPVSEIKRILERMPQQELAEAGIILSQGIANKTKRLSFVYHQGDTDGIFVSSIMPEGGLLVQILKCVGPDSAVCAMSLLSFAGNRLKKIIPPFTPVYLSNVGGRAMELIQKVKPDAEVYEVWIGEKLI